MKETTKMRMSIVAVRPIQRVRPPWIASLLLFLCLAALNCISLATSDAPGELETFKCEAPYSGSYEAGYFTQKLDHFDSKYANETWKQVRNNQLTTYLPINYTNLRFFQHFNIQKRYFAENESEQILFLFLVGESTIDIKFDCNDDWPYMKHAAKHGALVIQLEHRFFGYNQFETMK